jgi:hypothetical protein
MNNGVTWSASTSSVYDSAIFPYKLFNTTYANNTDKWITIVNTYASGVATSTAGLTSYIYGQSPQRGEWVQIQSSVPVVMYSYSLASSDTTTRLPKTFWIVGSNDGTNWYQIQTASCGTTAYCSGLYTSSSTFLVNSASAQTSGSATLTTTTYGSYTTSAYTYFRLIVLSVFGTSEIVTDFGEWNITFNPSTSTGPSRTLLYMDASNINLLDVSGSLALVNSNASTILVSPNTTTATKYTWQNNNVTWITNSSSYELSTPAYPYLAFNNAFIINPGYAIPWVTATTGYSTSTGAYTALTYGTPNVNQNGTIVNISGEWLQIQSSVPVILKNYFFGTQNAYPAGLPKTYTIIGSNDGTTWYDLQDGNFTAWPGNLLASNSLTSQYTPAYAVSTATTGTISNNSITSYTAQTNAYTFFRLIIKSTTIKFKCYLFYFRTIIFLIIKKIEMVLQVN